MTTMTLIASTVFMLVISSHYICGESLSRLTVNTDVITVDATTVTEADSSEALQANALLNASLAQSGGNSPPDEAERWVFLEEQLIEIGLRLKCRFTIEELANSNGFWSVFAGPRVTLGNPASIKELVTNIEQELKGVKVMINTQEGLPTVVHLIESPLQDKADYILNRSVSVEFTGTTHELLLELERQYGDIERRIMSATNDETDDQHTNVAFAVESKTLREVLTRAVADQEYGPILWRSTMLESRSGPATEILFLGKQEHSKD